jgi:putative ABC transport system permease protein
VRRGAVLPLVSAVLATALAIAAVVTAAGGAASLRLVTQEPRRFGAPWDALVSGGGGFASMEEAADALSAVPGVTSAAGLSGTDVAIGGDEQVWVQALLPIGDLPTTAPVIVSGRAPATDREIALGSVTMDDAGAGVGEEVRLEVIARDAPVPFRVVGVAMVTDGFEPNVGDGALVTPDGLLRIDPAALDEVELGIAVEDGPGRDAALAELRGAVAGTIAPFPVPSSLANAERIAELPLLLATGGALLAAITFVHALITSVRRNRRELAVCRVIGFTRRQVHAAVATQATALALAAVAIGLPLGVVGARWGWRTLARTFGVATGPVVPLWVVAAAGVATLVVANLAAGPPSRWMTRRQPAEALRTE